MSIIINPRQIIKDGITSLRDVWSSSKVSTELSGKQATLVSGTNIKTINNTSLLGSGDITISGGGGDIPKINMTATTATLDPNKFYVWGEVASLDISLAAETAGIQNVYKFQFQSGAIATTLTLPNNVSIDGEYPNAIKTTYIVSIESNIAKIERKRKEAILPNEYQQVEYIKSTGTQYINTGIDGSGTMTMTVDMQCNSGSQWAFGARYSSLERKLFLCNLQIAGNPGSYIAGYGSQQNGGGTSKINDGVRHLYEIRNGEFIIDSTNLQTYTASEFSTQCSLYLCAFNDYSSGAQFLSSVSLYQCNIFVNNATVASLYPCYRITDSVAGMYDIVRDIFVTNAGSGSFIVGPDV